MGKLAPLPAAYHSLSPQAHEYGLACTALPKDVSTNYAFVQVIASETCN